MNNLHETFGDANLDYEITDLQAAMIQSIVSFKLGENIEYDELTVLELIRENYFIIKVNSSGQIFEFGII